MKKIAAGILDWKKKPSSYLGKKKHMIHKQRGKKMVVEKTTRLNLVKISTVNEMLIYDLC